MPRTDSGGTEWGQGIGRGRASGLGGDVRPALDDTQGVGFVILETGFKGESGDDVQDESKLILKANGDGVGAGHSEELDLLNCPAFHVGELN